MASFKKRRDWKKLELQREKQIAETASVLAKWIGEGATVYFGISTDAFRLGIMGSLLRETEAIFQFVSRSREIISPIALVLYDSLELKEEAYQSLVLGRRGSSITLVRLPKGSEVDVVSLPMPWGAH